MGERALKLVDPETGEVHSACPECATKADEIAGLERDIRTWAVRYAKLKRERDQEARDHELWPKALRLFDEWKQRCRHPKARWSPDRFWLVFPFLSDDGYDLCLQAVRGAEFDPYRTRRKNGSTERHDSWELVFRDRGKFESFVNRAPR